MRDDSARLEDIVVAARAIAGYLARDGADDDILFDAIRVRLIEIGEAAKGLSESTRAQQPSVDWVPIARMRDLLAHRYFDTAHSIVMQTAMKDVPVLLSVVERMRAGGEEEARGS
ncbi:DUF86 domain-containing protein [Cnuibacter physcomitrellae]|uniref:HepT-like ribonuclease domain-containing protein n=1 Tax=Cnuibacter physcomitrellae TaxID=1619308 RepID=UPI0021758800|nr:HepT-like ribonuclease domain-containing protein [Cnuibacter physcomitrellae]MCS5497218.1 DUF86 domain-containing protein [Cnuibacter physcomitrellae]